MKKFLKLMILFTVIYSCAAAARAEESKFSPSGPLNIKNMMPLYLFYLSPMPDEAATLKKGGFAINASYHVANVIFHQRPWPAQQFGLTEKNREWWVYIDTEVNRFNLDVSYGILDNLELSADIPYYVFSEGFLDSFIENFEKTFPCIITPGARDETGRYNYEYEIRNRGNPVIYSTSKPRGLGEASFYLKYNILGEGIYCPATSARIAVKCPTAGDELIGSKKFDYSLGVLFDKNLFKRLFIFSNLNIVFVEKPDLMKDVDVLGYMVHGTMCFEYFLTNKTSFLFQAMAASQLYDGGIPCTKADPVVLTAGFNHNFSKNISWQITIDENAGSAAPDFGIYTGLKYKI